MSDFVVTTGGKEYVEPAVKLLSKVFEDDPVIMYMLCSLSEEKRLAYLPSWFRCLLTAAALNHAVFEEVNNWSCCAVWVPPGHKIDNPFKYIQSGFLGVLWTIGIKGCKRMLGEFQSQSNAIKKKGLEGWSRYYYLFFIGTALEQRKKGLSSGLIRRYQEIAAKDRLPIWLEATTAASMSLYAKLGFRTVQEMSLGKGTAGADGRPQVGGEGVSLWAMIWEPPKVA